MVLCSEPPNSPGRSVTKEYWDTPLRTADVSAVDSDISRRVKSRDFCNFFQEFHPLLRLHAHHLFHLAISGTPMVEQLLHVQVSPARQPLLRLLDCQRAYQPQARLPVREDPHHPRPALYLLVETFKAVGGMDAWAMAFREGWAQLRHSPMCSSMCSPTFSLPWRACNVASYWGSMVYCSNCIQ